MPNSEFPIPIHGTAAAGCNWRSRVGIENSELNIGQILGVI